MSTQDVPRQAEFIDDAAGLEALARALAKERRIAFDMESNGFFRYPERICLIQIASAQGIFLVDTAALEYVEPLGAVLADPGIEKIIHSADYDLRSLDRQWGFRVRHISDTSVGAHFCGLDKLGLGTVAAQFLGVMLEKEKRLQRADWGVRPLSQEALDYAAADVAYLLQLRDAISVKLAELGRTAWVEEECRRLEEIRYEGDASPETAYLSVKGSRTLDGRGLAVLKRLYLLREKEALRKGRPPFRVFGNDVLLHIAANPKAELKDAPGMTHLLLERYGRAIKQAMEEGLEAPPEKRPPPMHPFLPRPTAEQLARMQKLRAWRTEVGKQLSLDPALVWPMASLDRLMRTPELFDRELASPDVRRWQAAEFGASLRAALGG